MAAQILKRDTVNHRDGTSTNWVKWRTDIDDVVLQVAIFLGFCSSHTICLPRNIAWSVDKERHNTRIYTRLTITNADNGSNYTYTKSAIGHIFGIQMEELDGTGAVYWEIAKANPPGTCLCPLHVETVKDLLAGMLAKANPRGGKILVMEDPEIRKLQQAAIEWDEFAIASAIDQRNQMETYMAIDEYLCRVNAPVILKNACGFIQFFPGEHNPLDP